MQLPATFNNSIKNAFYDKTVSILGVTEVKEADGAVHKTSNSIVGTFKGNCRLVNFKQIQKEFGLDYQIDIAITTETNVSITAETLISYAGVTYQVTDVLPFDSHVMIVGAKWRNQQ